MFISEALKTHFETSATVRLNSLVLAEWNMNIPDNIYKLGNYRYRPTTQSSIYYNLPQSFDPLDIGNYYTGGTDADVTIVGGVTDENTPQLFTLPKEKNKLLYSLDDCTKPFRPRSGINKALYLDGKFLANSGERISERPRYYMPSRYDQFKYWSSYRTENNVERGIAKNIVNDLYYIDDAVPFVVYKENVPTNRLVVKMQTNIGSVDLGPFSTQSGQIADPLFGNQNKTTPSRWKIQKLVNNTWSDLYSFNENTTRSDGTPIIESDGYVELQYGLIIPEQYENIFVFAETLSSTTLLPESSIIGYSYLVIDNENDVGAFYIWNGDTYESFIPTYGWSLVEGEINRNTNYVTDFTSPKKFISEQAGPGVLGGIDAPTPKTVYREFEYIRGIRIVVDTMNKINSCFDLIEFSPRLIANISDKVVDYRITKILSDLSSSSLPVGQLLASNGEIQIFDDDQAFNQNNTNSIISKYVDKNIKFNFYEIIINVSGFDYYVPIKTLYSNGFPQADFTAGTLAISLRDFYFFLESMPAPRLLMTNTSLSMAVSTLLDYIGFSNYTFKRLTNQGLLQVVELDPIIPYFFVAPDQNVAQVLNQLALATQSAMFFDEYNNFVVMSKNYLLPGEGDRPIDFVLLGNNNQSDTGVVENNPSNNIPNILSIASQDKKVYNDGRINFTTRYIQRSYGNLRQALMVDAEKTWIYKPALLWEVSGTEYTKTINEVAAQQGNYVLGAMPINSDLTNAVPFVENGVVKNNVIDLGENVYWLTRYNGYFYANGEVIRYDAAQFNITGTGNVWISSNQEYQKYFASLPFNGKIYPTGLVRIYSVPFYETVDGIDRLQSGAVEKHGRGQFGTPVVNHSAGLNDYWSNNSYVRGCTMRSDLLFYTKFNLDFNITGVSSSGAILTMLDIAGLEIGQYVKIVAGPGELGGTTTVTAINTIPDPVTKLYSVTIDVAPTVPLSGTTVNFSKLPATTIGYAGDAATDPATAKEMTRNGIIKNFMATSYLSDGDVNKLKSTQTATVQSSALVMNGPSFKTNTNPLNFVSYVYKSLNNAYKTFGTRMRIIGKIETDENRVQTPIGSTPYYQVTGSSPDKNISIGGGSGGLAVLLNPETNNGYYFEITALTETNIDSYLNLDQTGQGTIQINNVVFYKIKKNQSNNEAIPIKLWGGLANIIVDDGRFTGQYRFVGEEKPTVYDLSVEYEDVGSTRRFFLYLNNKLIQVVDDTDPLPIYNNMALFVRGSSRCMFEHIYAIAANYSQNTVATVSPVISDVFGRTQESKTYYKNDERWGSNEINVNESFRKYAMSGVVQSTYLSGISAQQPPKYNIYFDEFGTIMRECSYFDIKYDRSYPALYAKLSPTFNRIKGYTVSGFQADSYGAEFLIFNATDTALNLDETTGNYLRIQGVTFTQDTSYELTVDQYFNKKSSFSDPELQGSSLITSPLVEKEKYDKIRLSRLNYGTSEFSLDSIYIQTQDDADALMGWLIDKTMVPKKSIGIDLFAIPTIQLGDIVTINYKNEDGLDLVVPDTTRFIVYNMEYARSLEGPKMTLFLSEV
jgi:hypothetical protein